MNLSRLLSFIIAFGLTIGLQAQTKTIPYQQLPTAGGNPTGSNMYFGATISASTITVTFTGPSDRWIAIGFGTAMVSTDALIYSNGQTASPHPLGWNDYYITLYSGAGVVNDAVQNWTIISNSVAASQRTVVATRSLSTGDASDVIFNFSSTALNLVWARGATADYTIAYHGSNNRANNISLPWLSSPVASFSSAVTVCQGTPLSYTNTSTGAQTSYTWSFEGGTPAVSNATNPVVSYSAPGVYSVGLVASNALGTNTFTQLNYITVNPTISPVIAISQVGGSNPMCAGAPLSFSATTTNGGSSPAFQWKVNGVNSGSNGAVFSTNAILNNALVNCVLSSNALCANPATLSSAAINLTVHSTAAASISIFQNIGSNPMCFGSLAGYSANIGNGGTSPNYQWKINNINSGGNSSTFTVNTLSNADVISCELYSSNSCASNTLGLSNSITANVSNVLVPSLSITLLSGNNPACAGAQLSFSVSSTNGGGAPVYQWKVNGVNSGSNSNVFTGTLSNSSTITCEMFSSSSCANPSVVLSSPITLTIYPIPTVPVISISGATTVCAGQTVTLSSSASSGNLWSNGSTANSISVSSSGTFAVQQSSNSCFSPSSAIVSILVNPLPLVSMNTLPLFCTEDAPLVLSQGSPSGGQYSGNGVSNGLFDPLASGTGSFVILYQYTDANSCSATASITAMVDACTSLTEFNDPAFSITIYPNPVENMLHAFSKNEEILAYRILGNASQEIKTGSCNSKHLEIDMREFKQGVYVLELHLKNKRILQYKIIH